MKTEAYVVLDIGKTNIRLTALDAGAQPLAQARRPNAPVDRAPYLQHDVEAIWSWLLDTLASWSSRFDIAAIVPVTHGATAALVDGEGLVLPVLDYEVALEGSANPDLGYGAVRPLFGASCSPALEAGLNLGRQLFWQQACHARAFERARHILMYPQYWAWRLSGVAAAELTSLGCHTDLWEPGSARYSTLVGAMGWDRLMAPLQPADATLGTLLPALAAQTGVRAGCRIVCGIHDSNASLLRHLDGGRRIVLSTGTWVIAAAIGAAPTPMDERRDMLANVSAWGLPVACMRFMGGREFSALAGAAPQVCTHADLASLVASGSMALPCFAGMGGPYAGQTGCVAGPPPATPGQRYALATLYCALMTDCCINHLDPGAPVVVEGRFGANPWFAGVLAALGPERQVTVSDDTNGTTAGGWMLATGKALPAGQRAAPVTPVLLPGLAAYARAWRNLNAARGNDQKRDFLA